MQSMVDTHNEGGAAEHSRHSQLSRGCRAYNKKGGEGVKETNTQGAQRDIFQQNGLTDGGQSNL